MVPPASPDLEDCTSIGFMKGLLGSLLEPAAGIKHSVSVPGELTSVPTPACGCCWQQQAGELLPPFPAGHFLEEATQAEKDLPQAEEGEGRKAESYNCCSPAQPGDEARAGEKNSNRGL